jgi:hypothetical protein
VGKSCTLLPSNCRSSQGQETAGDRSPEKERWQSCGKDSRLGESRRLAGVTRSLPIYSTAERTKRRRGQRQRLGNPVLLGTTGSTITQGGQQLHRRVSLRLEARGSLNARISELGLSEGQYRRTQGQCLDFPNSGMTLHKPLAKCGPAPIPESRSI